MDLTAFCKNPCPSGLVALYKTGRMMIIRTFILLVTCLQLSAIAYTQEITLSVKNVPLETLFTRIQQQTPYRFVYTNEQLEGTKKISLSVTNATLAVVLERCFRDQPLNYSIEEKFIIVRRKEKTVEKQGSPAAGIDLTGKVLNEQGEPVTGVTVSVKGTGIATATDTWGEFKFTNIDTTATLVFTSVNTETLEMKLDGKKKLVIVLKTKITGLADVAVTVSTGYQDIPRERATGSFSFVDNKLINRSVSTNVLDRIENLVPGVLFNKGDAANTDPLLIRGRSTIYANAAPLIVLDNFPYDGDLNNINPNDVESITVLKDAAAASIWGARAGNGVIVITTKKGKTGKPRIELNSNFSFQQRPDLFNIKTISGRDYIELEKNLFAKSYYATDEFFNQINYGHPPLTPVIELLIAKRDGLIPPAVADAQIEGLKKHDVRSDLQKYFYRNSINQQHSITFSGNTPVLNYYLSAGWDRNLSNLAATQLNRVALRSKNIFKINEKLQADASFNYVQSTNVNGNNPGYNLNSGSGKALYPYAQLADANGNPLNLVRDYRAGFTDTAGAGNLLNWKYNPIRDISNEKNTVKTRDFTLSTAIHYQLTHALSAEIRYQFENQLINGSDLHNDASYFTRDLINQFSQFDPVSGSVTYPLPLGGIIDNNSTELISHQARAQLNFYQSWKAKQQVSAIAGWEIKSLTTTANNYRSYGYEPDNSTINTLVDFLHYYPIFTNVYSTGQIPNPQNISKKVDHFLSWYANASYTFNNRYTLSVSAREDEANLFGVKANQKGTPLWSAGAGWTISKENFYRIGWLPFLKLRVTYGYNGNISRLASAYTTATYNTANTTPAVEATILTPPNEKLRWEQVGTFNVGLDFESRNKIISGTIEYFRKNGKDLLGQAPVDPTLGLTGGSGQSFYYGNVAAMKGKGIDLELRSRNIDGRFKWSTNFIIGYAVSQITKYLASVSSTGAAYLTPIGSYYINPVIGKPVYAVYSYPWAGLDRNTGDPLGRLNGKNSNDYAAMYQLPLDSLVYNGPAQPLYSAALRNSFQWKNVSLSFNISYKGGYYFRRTSINYDNLFSSWTGSGDYAASWQQPGDEKKTSIPSMVFPSNPQRDGFYQYSQVLVEKADNIRFEDINLGFDMDRLQLHGLPVNHIHLYLYMANLGFLWKAAKSGTDPYYNNIPMERKRVSIGATITF